MPSVLPVRSTSVGTHLALEIWTPARRCCGPQQHLSYFLCRKPSFWGSFFLRRDSFSPHTLPLGGITQQQVLLQLQLLCLRMSHTQADRLNWLCSAGLEVQWPQEPGTAEEMLAGKKASVGCEEPKAGLLLHLQPSRSQQQNLALQHSPLPAPAAVSR